MKKIIETLKDNFVIIDLGSSFSKANTVLANLAPAITLIEIDALDAGDTKSSLFHRHVKIKKGIHVSGGKKIFQERKHFPCSSFLNVKEDVVKMFGIEDATRTVNKIEMECMTVSDLLESEKIKHVDLFKTDLEGLDSAILRSSEEFLKSALVVQSELRFQPCYESEPFFFETCAFLSNLGFEVISIKPEHWKYNTRHRESHRDGRIVFGDFIFFRKLDNTHPDFANHVLKQILIAKSFDLHSHAEYLFEQHKNALSPEIVNELSSLVSTTASSSIPVKLFNMLASLPGSSRIRNSFLALYKVAAVNKRFPWWVSG